MLALGMLAVATVGGKVRAMVLVGVPRDFNGADRFLAFVGVTMLAVAFWELLVYSVAMTVSQTQFKVKSRLRALSFRQSSGCQWTLGAVTN